MIVLKGIDPSMIANNLEASNLIHPGEMIRDEIESRGMTQKNLADMTGMSPKTISNILNCKQAVTIEDALLLEAALGIDADIWIGLQNDYDKQKAKKDKSFLQRLESVKKYAALI